jgi:hypothetical protein
MTRRYAVRFDTSGSVEQTGVAGGRDGPGPVLDAELGEGVVEVTTAEYAKAHRLGSKCPARSHRLKAIHTFP